MGMKLVVPVTPANVAQAVAALAAAGIDLSGAGVNLAGNAAMGAPPNRPAGAMPPPPGGSPATVPPPPQAAPPAAPANPRLDSVLRLMDTYSKAGHGAAGARKVLAQVGLQRAQDGNEEQLAWLEQAFANTQWAPA